MLPADMTSNSSQTLDAERLGDLEEGSARMARQISDLAERINRLEDRAFEMAEWLQWARAVRARLLGFLRMIQELLS